MEGAEGDGGIEAPSEHPTATRQRRIAPGQVWIACALCRRPVELSDSVETVEGHVCPDCIVGL